MVALNKLPQHTRTPLKTILPPSMLRNLIPPFEELFGLHGRVGVHDGEGQAYYGAAVSDESFDVYAPVSLPDHTVIGVVGIYDADAALQPAIDYLALNISQVATETWRRRLLTEEVLERYDELNLIYDLGVLIAGHGLTQTEIVKTVLEQTNRILKASSGVIYLYNNATPRELVPISYFGQQTDRQFWLGRTREFALSTLYAYEDAQLSEGGTVICAPLRHGEERLGALVLLHDETGRTFNASDAKLLTTLTHNTALFIQAARLYDSLMTRNQELVKTLDELQSAREELSRTERLSIIGQTVSGLIHDMRNPLSIVMGYAGLLQEGGLTEAESHEYATQIIQYINVFSAMAEEVLDYTRSDEHLKIQSVPLDSYLGTIENLLTPPGLVRPVRIDVRTDKVQGLYANLDAQRFARVFQNLVNNAVDAVEEHGGSQVVIDAEPLHNNMIRFSVADDGPGIPEDMVQHVFEPFVTGKAHGTGLGLAIVSRMIEQHGGTIHYETSPQGGACFVFTVRRA